MRDTLVTLVTMLSLLPAMPLAAQDRYLEPPAVIARILAAPMTPAVSVSPTRDWLLLMERPSLPGIAEVAAPDLRLAGIRLDPRANGPSRAPGYTGLVLRAVNGAVERRMQVPGGRIGNIEWSPDGKRFAFSIASDRGLSLQVADVATGTSREIPGLRLNAASGAPCSWIDAGSLLCRTVPASRGVPPVRTVTPAGPVIQESEGRVAPNRTYQDLLKDQTDEALFDYYFTSQLVEVRVDGGTRPVGAPAVYLDVAPSPDGRFLLVETVHRPYSYLVPLNRFPLRFEVWSREGAVVRLIADRPLQDEVPSSFDAVPVGPRGIGWRADQPATAQWTEATDGGDPRRRVGLRDEVRLLPVPFTGQPAALFAAEWRVRQVQWTARGQAVVSESWNRTSMTRTWLLEPGAKPRKLVEISSEDRYGDPGSFLTAVTPTGTRLIQTTADGRTAWLAGEGASVDGDRPFLDQFDLASGKATRLWRSEAPWYENPVALIDPARGLVLALRESATEPPNYVIRDLKRKTVRPLTSFTDPAPEFAGVTRQLITYPRADGVQLSATLYLPAGYRKEQGPLPFFFWAYPREFRSADAAAQVIGSPYRFTRPTGASHLFLLLAGYGVLDNPTMPIVAEGGKDPNDSYVEQLVAGAAAAVEKVVALGVADRNRVGIGGHSYGGFMTANLLAHSDLFKAGVARSGAYNRTLTPFGFQAEERTWWQAQEIYTRMSPFTYADKVNEPILLIHGQDDDNSGTFPIQSERFYAALRGNGARTRLVMLPAEAHGYRARESVGHTLAETIRWMDRYVKGEGLTP